MNEHSRQLVHLSGVVFVLFAQAWGGPAAALYFLAGALFFLAYGGIVRKEARKLKALEGRLREFALSLERENVPRPFTGAFWFYFSCGLAFLAFPFQIASAACIMLAVGDSLSTLVGIRYGMHHLLADKTLEGSIAFFATSFIAGLIFVSPIMSLGGAIAATAAEMVPGIGKLRNLKGRGLIDDNLTIPLIAGAAMLLISI
ncbi:MAG: hypothetical protein HY518_01500 [Candidatus Aenigmarchaeota archaeon]|nr:hypothetical protein [Candidatus Aenigmarchaeota archaeon]